MKQKASVLLEPVMDMGLPLEYILSRVRARRAALISDWEPLLSDPSSLEGVRFRHRGLPQVSVEAFWTYLVKEYRWMYSQMNARLRSMFSLFFVYTELRTIFIRLRHIKAGRSEAAEGLLSISLLSQEIKSVLRNARNIQEAAEKIEKSFAAMADSFAGLAQAMSDGGLKDFEQQLANTYLEYASAAAPHTLIKDFFERIINARNIISLYKCLRMNKAAVPVFISGGTIPKSVFQEILNMNDISRLISIVKEEAGIKTSETGPNIETLLYRGITRRMRKAGREPLSFAVILDYLWRCSIEAMNLGVIFHAKGLERDVIAAEIVH